MTLADKAAIVGIGASSFERDPDRSVLTMAGDALSRALADAGGARHQRRLLIGEGQAQRIGAERAENGERRLGADAADGEQQVKDAQLVFALKAEQGEGVFAHLQVGVQENGSAFWKARCRRFGRMHFEPHTAGSLADIHHKVVPAACCYDAA